MTAREGETLWVVLLRCAFHHCAAPSTVRCASQFSSEVHFAAEHSLLGSTQKGSIHCCNTATRVLARHTQASMVIKLRGDQAPRISYYL